MRTETPQPVRLADYRPPSHLIDTVHLDFDLQPSATRVKATLTVRRNGDSDRLVLDGEGLKTLSVTVDGKPFAYDEAPETLTLTGLPEAFTLETEVEIDPAGNTALMGLYMSGGRYCTQCEAEGFRRITWFLDRPDVLSRYTVRMEADAGFHHLLANGNLTGSGEAGERHYAEWEDPFPKPCYLFAMVAGELDVLEDSFTTMTGREVALKVFVDPGMASRAEYALDSLKRAMKWDEEVFGREYDLDLFMIVAVRDFNFGAMENKGLNIFNSSLLLADSATATDMDYERIESVVAHEYFHNWTGDRITCRDWFQLCLKEGLTVFRDQEFSADMRGAAVQRIKDVKALRARQFPEDAGPLAHPVRPNSYLKIDNFYTATIYEKGSEVIRMLKALLGDQGFKAGMDLYFDRHDGEATTVEAFVRCFTDATGRDLSAFFGWYEQAGTPKVTISRRYDAASGKLELTLRQQTAPTPGQPDKVALPLPVAVGLLDEDGREQAPTQMLVLDGPETTITLEGVSKPPVLSALRGFSAPVKLETDAPGEHDYVLLASDPDLFNRWESGQRLATRLMLARAEGQADAAGELRYAQAVGRALDDQAANAAFKALLLALPSEQDLAMEMRPADPAAIHGARRALREVMAGELAERLARLHEALADHGAFSADAEAAGRRALRNAALDLLTAGPAEAVLERARAHYGAADNMTDAMGGLTALVALGGDAAETALAAFHARWKSEPLVIDKWFAAQARDGGEGALDRIVALTRHADFDAPNPNRLRALVGTFASFNPARFHAEDGAGYRFLADWIIATDKVNPMTAARFVEALGGWRRYREDLGAKMREQLQRIAAVDGLSKNVFELATKALA
ncbi:aminopeptidase N [Caulobacter sp. SLTY]|uniref:aminopeptidase N n=1 Tax=Caulobacter sp. SLTY TaxID=2683262 RepID=UPI001412C596|nr:aminopeptidase N [Caulobacter sp. SLTY]NBB17149.1 aminopeptidase N [Caulobacter sp. SLTY]